MKLLKIDNNKGFYSLDGIEWISVDLLSKEHLLTLVKLIIKQDVELELFDASKINNQVHQIIYKSIYEKLSALQLDRNKFKDESERLYLKEIEKYKREDLVL